MRNMMKYFGKRTIGQKEEVNWLISLAGEAKAHRSKYFIQQTEGYKFVTKGGTASHIRGEMCLGATLKPNLYCLLISACARSGAYDWDTLAAFAQLKRGTILGVSEESYIKSCFQAAFYEHSSCYNDAMLTFTVVCTDENAMNRAIDGVAATRSKLEVGRGRSIFGGAHLVQSNSDVLWFPRLHTICEIPQNGIAKLVESALGQTT